MSEDRIELARALFAAWSSGDPDAPAAYFHPEGVLFDTVGGTHEGWPAVREFFADGCEKWADLELVPNEFWTNDAGVALTWEMSASMPDGRKWRVPGMSYLVITDGKVTYEADHWHGGAVAASLEA